MGEHIFFSHRLLGIFWAAFLCILATPACAQTSEQTPPQSQTSQQAPQQAPVGRVAASPDYRLGVGDAVRIQVHGQEDLTVQVRLEAHGFISFPLLGDIQAVGQTVSQLQSTITKKLREDYLVNPDVQVLVLEHRPFFILGEVNRPGGYPYVPGLTVRKAASLAGGFTERASTKKIYVQHESDPEQKRFGAGLDDPVQPGDTVVIEEGIF